MSLIDRDPLTHLLDRDALVVRQRKEWGEILAGWETLNRYAVQEPVGGRQLAVAGEVAGPWALLLRQLLRNQRPFTVELRDADGAALLKVQRIWRLFGTQIEVYGPDGTKLGRVKRRRFTLVNTVYDVFDAADATVGRVVGPMFRPWTFRFEVDGQERGRIEKKWVGLGKEMFSDADTFGVSFQPGLPAHARALLLGATFLVDFLHFER